MKGIMKWSHTHTLATLAILGVAGYLVYNKYMKPKAGMTNFTGSQTANNKFINRYANASGNEPTRTY